MFKIKKVNYIKADLLIYQEVCLYYICVAEEELLLGGFCVTAVSSYHLKSSAADVGEKFSFKGD